MIEVFAAIIGASIGVIGVSAAGFTKRNSESREAIIKLTAGVEAIASKLEDLHQDYKTSATDIYKHFSVHIPT